MQLSVTIEICNTQEMTGDKLPVISGLEIDLDSVNLILNGVYSLRHATLPARQEANSPLSFFLDSEGNEITQNESLERLKLFVEDDFYYCGISSTWYKPYLLIELKP